MAKGGYQKRRIEAKKQQERRARKRAKRRKQWMTGAIAAGLAVLIIIILLVALTGPGKKKDLASTSPSPSASPAATGSPLPGCTAPDDAKPNGKQFKAAPKSTVDSSKIYVVTFSTTCGPIEMRLDPKLAPASVNNFVFLAKQHYYDHTIFHRIQTEADFAIVQGGDPQGTGSGGPGYAYKGEKPKAGTKYLRGTIAMANSGDPSSNGSQFFVVVHDWASLPANYTVFGHVTDPKSLATLDTMITAQGTPIQGGLGTTPVPSIKINSTKVSTASR